MIPSQAREAELSDSPTRSMMIVGAGHAGGSAAGFARQFGWTGPITLIGEEPLPPYQRPPLSKAWLKGDVTAEDLELRSADFYESNGISLQLGVRVQSLARQNKTIALADGRVARYDKLILATGARPRRINLPGAELKDVLELRTVADAERLRLALSPGRRIAIIGAGYVGLEVAAAARALGASVVVIEREARVLARVAGEALSSFFYAYHRSRGVSFELAASVLGFRGDGGRVSGAQLGDGRIVRCDVVLVGVGAEPNCELASEAGLSCNDGVVVDLMARTEDPDVYAIGDCTRRPLPLYGCMGRLESVPNALEQAKQAAAHLCGSAPPPLETPWFWSDQYDLKLQIAGVALGATETVIRGRPEQGRFAVFHLDPAHRIRAVEAVNSAAEFMVGRQLIAAGAQIPVATLSDPSRSLRELVS